MKKYLSIAILAMLLLIGCAKDQIQPKEVQTNKSQLTVDEINTHLISSIENNGVFKWSTVDANFIWSAAMHSDSIFAIGYQTKTTQNIKETIHLIDIQDSEWTQVKNDILNMILEGEKELGMADKIKQLLPLGQPETLPTMEVRITNKKTIEKLRNMSEIRYVEPMGYSLPSMTLTAERSSSGCSGSPSYNLNSSDYNNLAPNVKRSWHHNTSDIAGAWTRTSGDGVTVCVIDTGASDDQENLGSQFNSGQSQGRTVTRLSTHYTGMWWWRKLEAPHDQCGHGTSMCGFATAPRGSDGNSVGVAYNSDLLSIRAVEDVIINTSNEKKGVKSALIIAGNTSNVKVISMSIGTPFSSGTVADGVYYAYNKGKMIMAAAGTSLTWTNWYGVIFPANMNQTVAVTGVTDGAGAMEECSTCHYGNKVDFSMIMERASNSSRTSLSLAVDTNQPKYVGGSSAATATVAGIAALVFADTPGATRAQVFNALKVNSSFYPNEDSDFGWGIIDAKDAVDEL